MRTKTQRRSRYHVFAIAMMAAIGSLLTLAVSPASANAKAPVVSVDEARAAVQRIAEGKSSPADLALIESVPGLAEKVVDPKQTTITTTKGSLPNNARAVPAETCGWYKVDLTQKSTAGFTIFVWRHYVEYCYNGQRVNRWRNRFDQVIYSDVTVEPGTLLVDTKTPTPGLTVSSRMQRQIKQCAPGIGCYATYLPWSQINVNRWGGATYTSGGII